MIFIVANTMISGLNLMTLMKTFQAQNLLPAWLNQAIVFYWHIKNGADQKVMVNPFSVNRPIEISCQIYDSQ